MKNEFSYDNFISRNYMYISSKLQDKIKNVKITFFGTGLSSNIALQCVRLGFLHMHLNDGDKVELSNLNRQAFNSNDIGLSKASVVRNKILNINPTCHITIGENYINNANDFIKQIDNSDIVINTVDCNKTYFDIIEYGREKDKLVICPFNPGFSGLVISFNKNSAASHEMFDLGKEKK